jgi:hypothetical protein
VEDKPKAESKAEDEPKVESKSENEPEAEKPAEATDQPTPDSGADKSNEVKEPADKVDDEPETDDSVTDDAKAGDAKPAPDAKTDEPAPPPTTAAPWEAAPVTGTKTDSDTKPDPEATEPKADEAARSDESPEPAPDVDPEAEPKPIADDSDNEAPKPEETASESDDGTDGDKPVSDTPSDAAPSDAPAEPNHDDANPNPAPGTLGEAGAIAVPASTGATPDMPAPADSSDSTPVASTAPAASLVDKPPLTPHTHPAPFNLIKTLKIGALVLAGLVVLGGAASAAYLYTMSPKTALGAYLQRVATAKTGLFASSVSATSDGYHFTLKLDGKSDVTDATKPKLDLGITGEISAAKGVLVPVGENTTGSVSGHVVVTDQTLYFKVVSLSFLSGLIPKDVLDTWYKYDLGQTEPGKCMKQGKGKGSYLGSDILTDIPVKKAAFAGLETVNGAQSLHYRGVIDNDKIKAAVDKANQKLSADCKLDISADDYKGVSITYDLWRGFAKDRLKLSINDAPSKTNTEVMIDSSAYDKPVKIDAPSGAKDVEQLLKDLQSQQTLGATSVLGAATKNDVAAPSRRRSSCRPRHHAQGRSRSARNRYQPVRRRTQKRLPGHRRHGR